ncbi:cobyric acid synthase [Aphanothece sacrum FPU1]|uniref:Cobyric acid synthase n=1 Tax=Aphanothece sacrum FPU1 TaxID=1920663 RepID=A0A401IH54_APHSA|nr:cobyric acid synthase [Aphanothece sacrum FPU1]GBF85921.1 cobyric acid synthase [Aphanothece sacrum FPU3]
MTSQVIIKGKVIGTTKASEYYENYFNLGWEAITSSLERLALEYDFVVCEGAGSPIINFCQKPTPTALWVIYFVRYSTSLYLEVHST